MSTVKTLMTMLIICGCIASGLFVTVVMSDVGVSQMQSFLAERR